MPTADATGPDGGTSEPSHQHLLPVGHHLLPFGLRRDVIHPHDDVLVEFSVGGGFGPSAA